MKMNNTVMCCIICIFHLVLLGWLNFSWKSLKNDTILGHGLGINCRICRQQGVNMKTESKVVPSSVQ